MHLDPSARSDAEPDSSLTGMFGVSLTRAVLPYTDREGLSSPPGGRIRDIGMGVVIDGTDPARADVLDLGSAEQRVMDLAGPVALLGWLYPSGLRSMMRVVADEEFVDAERAQSFTFQVALKVLRNAGFGPLTRPTLLRIGFRDLCQDLDLHEGTAVRLVLSSGAVVRIHMEYETGTLVARSGRVARNSELEGALAEAFPGRELLRGTSDDPVGAAAYHIPFPISRNLSDLRGTLGGIRKGLLQMLARFEPERYRSLRDLSKTFGERDSLRSLEDRSDLPRLEPVSTAGVHSNMGARGVH